MSNILYSTDVACLFYEIKLIIIRYKFLTKFSQILDKKIERNREHNRYKTMSIQLLPWSWKLQHSIIGTLKSINVHVPSHNCTGYCTSSSEGILS